MSASAITEAEAVALLAALAAAIALAWLLAWQAVRLAAHGARAALKRLKGVQNWRAHPVRAWIEARLPRLYRLLAPRLDPARFTGLPLTLVAVAGFYLLVLFAGLIEEVMEAEEIERIDEGIVSLIAPLRHPLLVDLFRWITELGGTATLSAVAVVATGFLWAHGPRSYIAPVWLTVLGSQVTTWGGKFIVARPRPDFVLDISAYSPSFPSGHAAGAAAVYGIIAYAILRDLPGPRARFEVAFWTVVLVALIAFSRIFLSVHHPSDVAAGLLVGGFWLLAGIALAEATRAAAQ